MEYILLTLPVAFLVVSVIFSVKAVKKGTAAKKAFFTQLASFSVATLIFLAVPIVVNAAASDAATTSEIATQVLAAQANSEATSWGFIAAALSVGLAGIGGGIAVAAAAPAAIGATSEDPSAFGKSIIFVALGEGIALYGLLVSILIYSKI